MPLRPWLGPICLLVTEYMRQNCWNWPVANSFNTVIVSDVTMPVLLQIQGSSQDFCNTCFWKFSKRSSWYFFKWIELKIQKSSIILKMSYLNSFFLGFYLLIRLYHNLPNFQLNIAWVKKVWQLTKKSATQKDFPKKVNLGVAPAPWRFTPFT